MSELGETVSMVMCLAALPLVPFGVHMLDRHYKEQERQAAVRWTRKMDELSKSLGESARQRAEAEKIAQRSPQARRERLKRRFRVSQ